MRKETWIGKIEWSLDVATRILNDELKKKKIDPNMLRIALLFLIDTKKILKSFEGKLKREEAKNGQRHHTC